MARPQKIDQPPRVSGLVRSKSRQSLLLEFLWFVILILPSIVFDLFSSLIPPKGKSLDGKVVLVAGAARGLGRELALGFARLGSKVACVDEDQNDVLDTAAEIVRDGERARAYFTNVTRVEEIIALRESVEKDFGPVDILVYAAAISNHQRLDDSSDTALKTVVAVNFVGYVWMAREFLRTMKARGTGHMVAVSSLTAHSALANASVDAACSRAVAGFMEGLRLEVSEQGYDNIHFTTVYAPFTEAGVARPSRLLSLYKRPEEVAVRIIVAVTKNDVSVTIPDYYYYVCFFNQLLPTGMADWAVRLWTGGGVNLSTTQDTTTT